MRIISGGGGSDSNTLLLVRFSDDWSDSSQYQRELTLGADTAFESTSPVSSVFGPYAEFVGTTNLTAGWFSVQIDDFDLNQPWTIEGWLRRVGTGASNTYLQWATKGALVNPWVPPLNVSIVGATNVISVTHRTTAGTNNVQFSSVDGQWHHHATTHAAGVINYYLDGVNVQTISLPGAFNVETGPLVFGAFLSGGPIFGMNGYCDDIRVSRVVRYDGAFSPPGPHRR